MKCFAYRNTERGARAALMAREEIARQERLSEERAKYQAELERQAKIAEARRAQAARAAAFREEMRILNHRHRHLYSDIERRAIKLFKITRAELHSNRRNREIVFARQFVMYWAARLTNLSLPQIGRLIGGRDHTTVLHGRKNYARKRAEMGRYLRDAR